LKPAPFAYCRPHDVGAAVEALRQCDGIAKVLAGGQSLVPMLNLRLAPAHLVVDITGIDTLQGAEDRDGAVVFGACVTHAAIEDGRVPDPAGGLMRAVAAGIAYRAIRTAGTIGGSVALADPSAEWPATLLALDAVFDVSGPAGARRVPVQDFFAGAYTTALVEDDVLTGIAVPRLSAAARWGVHKTCRKTGEFATSFAVAVADPERGVHRVALTGTGGAPLRLPASEAVLAERADGEAAGEAIRRDLTACGRDFDAYKAQVHAATVRRAVMQVLR
jgi:carbon-monoxide dehydrogenase medium subunit